jgi:peptidoglycan/LPS O-acetylase OafA/YrhL
MDEFKYRPDVDALRAVAVIMVLFYHAGLGFPGGFIGVDIFFVISGYLITGLILKSQSNGTFSVVKFFERRIRRIVPAAALMVVGVLIAGYFLLLPSDYEDLAKSAIAQQFMFSNIYFWESTGYFAEPAESKPLLHTWSLAIEEQFYLGYPFVLVVLNRYQRQNVGRYLLVLAILSLAGSHYGVMHHRSATFYLLPTRAWELLIGGLICFAPNSSRISQRLRSCISWLCLAGILSAGLLFDSKTRFPGINALLPCMSTAVFIYVNTTQMTRAAEILTVKPVVYIGLMSYSLYLWHWPVLVFARYSSVAPLSPWQSVVLLGAGLVFATLSWVFVETPFRRSLLFASQLRVFSFAFLTTVITALIALGICMSAGFPSRLPQGALRSLDTTYPDRVFVQQKSREIRFEDAMNGDFLELGSGGYAMPVSILLWGDSHAVALIPLVDSLCAEYSVRGSAAVYAATAPLVGWEDHLGRGLKERAVPFNDSVVEFIRHHSVSDVIIVAHWDLYEAEQSADQIRLLLQNTLRELKEAKARIWVMKTVPIPDFDVPKYVAKSTQLNELKDLGISAAEYRKARQRQSQIFNLEREYLSGVHILDPAEYFVRDEVSLIAKDGKILYCDDTHLSVLGAMELRPLFEPIFREIVAK